MTRQPDDIEFVVRRAGDDPFGDKELRATQGFTSQDIVNAVDQVRKGIAPPLSVALAADDTSRANAKAVYTVQPATAGRAPFGRRVWSEPYPSGTARVDAGCVTTSGSPVVTDAAIGAGDIGSFVTGAGIPATTFVGPGSVAGVSIRLSSSPIRQVDVNATASATVSLTVTVTQYDQYDVDGYNPDWYDAAVNPFPGEPSVVRGLEVHFYNRSGGVNADTTEYYPMSFRSADGLITNGRPIYHSITIPAPGATTLSMRTIIDIGKNDATSKFAVLASYNDPNTNLLEVDAALVQVQTTLRRQLINGETADVFQVRAFGAAANQYLMSMSAAGRVGLGLTTDTPDGLGAMLNIIPLGTTTAGLRIKQFSSGQLGNLQEWLLSDGTFVFKIGKKGRPIVKAYTVGAGEYNNGESSHTTNANGDFVFYSQTAGGLKTITINATTGAVTVA